MNVHNPEESYNRNTRLKWFLVILALLINLLLLLLLFIINVENDFWKFPPVTPHDAAPVVFEQMPEPPPPLELPKPQPHEVAALKPGASNFGTPDEEKEDEMLARISNDETTEKSDILEASEHTGQQQEQNTPQPQPELSKEPPQELAQAQILEGKENKQHDQTTQKPDQKAEKPKPLMAQQQKIQETIKAPLKKELNFSDLAKGFISSLNEGGNDLVERKGNENIRPDFEEMRTLSYQHKLIWYMQNEWRRITITLDCSVPPFLSTGISMTVDKDGALKKVAVVQSCGIQQLDDAIIRGIKAASPYPPLPSFLKKDSFTFEFGVKHVSNSSINNLNYHFR